MPMDEEKQEDFSSEKVSNITTWVYDRTGECVEKSQWVIQERPVTLYVNGREMVTLLCAGHHLEELAVGFLYADGFLQSYEDLAKIDVDVETGKIDIVTRADTSIPEQLWMKRTITSGCGKGTVFYYALDALLSRKIEGNIKFSPFQVLERMEEMHRMSEIYRHTHGVHNTLLATPEKILLFRDDIGRHNAVDMMVGHAFLNRIPLDDKMLITTGRLTSEILIKAAKVNIPVLISRNTATTLAIELAQSLNITLIGFVRAGKFTVYSGRERIME